MANANWNGGKSKGRAQAYARLRHNDNERRADPQVEHTNREIDKSRTYLNFEVGPTAGLTYEQKKARLDARLDEFGYPSDAELKRLGKNAPTSMQSVIIYAPAELDNEDALMDGSLEAWFAMAADELVKLAGAENVISFAVDVDEVHEYTDARTGKRTQSKFHAHAAVVPVCDVKQVARQPVYLRPDGSETLDEAEAERVYIDRCNAETTDIDRAARDENGDPITGPKCARLKNGRRKYRKQKRSEATKATRKLSGSEFASRERMSALNAAIHRRTEREFGMKWNTHELGTYQRTDADENKSVEELKAASAAREIDARIERAAREIEQNTERAEMLLAQADELNDAARKREREADARYRAVERQVLDMEGESYTPGSIAPDGTFNPELDFHTFKPALEPGIQALEREIAAKRRALSDLDAREASLKTREAMLAAREHEVSTKEADADARSRQAASKARNAEMLISMAEKLIDRFIGNAIERFAAKLERLAGAADKAAGDRPQQRGLWRTVSDAAGAIARHVHEHAGGETMKEWASADVVALYGQAPDRQHEFVADLWSYADVSAQRGRTAGDGAESWLGQARHANTLADILNRLGDPVIDGWLDGDEFLLERLEGAGARTARTEEAAQPEPDAHTAPASSPGPGAPDHDGPSPCF